MSEPHAEPYEGTEHPAYPVGLRLAGRRVVIVGGGTVAQRRLPALLAAGADVPLISPSVTPSVEAMVDAGELTWERRRYAEGDLAEAWYALVATDDPAMNTAVLRRGRGNRVWCVRSDEAAAATAWTPATGPQRGRDRRRTHRTRSAALRRGARRRRGRAARGHAGRAASTAPTGPASHWSAADPATPT